MKTLTIESLIIHLQDLQKKGIEVVQIEGTLMCIDNGNSIIATTEKQF